LGAAAAEGNDRSRKIMGPAARGRASKDRHSAVVADLGELADLEELA
jgi:hypothetical protein